MDPHTRRDILKGSITGAATLLATSAPMVHAAPGRQEAQRRPTFVFVAGANGSASVPTDLLMRGHRAVGVDLPGHGPTYGQFPRSYQAPQDLEAFATEPSPVAGITIDDSVDRTIDVVRRVAENGPVVLVGGSMGGALVSRVGNTIPTRIDWLVYDAAFCCVDLPTIAEYLQTPEGSTTLIGAVAKWNIGDPTQLGAAG